MRHNYFNWRKAVVDEAVNKGVSIELIASQNSELFQDFYFNEELTIDQAAERLIELSEMAIPNK